MFERPSFKESSERLLLAVAQAEEIDRPVLAPIAFVAPVTGGAKVTRPNGHSDNGNAGLMQEPDENRTARQRAHPSAAPAALPEFADQSQAESETADPAEPVRNHRRRCDRDGASDLRCYLYATSRRAQRKRKIAV